LRGRLHKGIARFQRIDKSFHLLAIRSIGHHQGVRQINNHQIIDPQSRHYFFGLAETFNMRIARIDLHQTIVSHANRAIAVGRFRLRGRYRIPRANIALPKAGRHGHHGFGGFKHRIINADVGLG
jgi:hypothetical protein